MKQLLCTLLLFVFSSQVFAQHLDTSRYVILDYDSLSYYKIELPPNSVKSRLTQAEISKAEFLLEKSIKEYNAKQKEYFNSEHLEHPRRFPKNEEEYYINNLQKYKQQFTAVITQTGEKVVWINCLCYTVRNWKKEIIRVDDGGNCFFDVKINISKNTYYDFRVNPNG